MFRAWPVLSRRICNLGVDARFSPWSFTGAAAVVWWAYAEALVPFDPVSVVSGPVLLSFFAVLSALHLGGAAWILVVDGRLRSAADVVGLWRPGAVRRWSLSAPPPKVDDAAVRAFVAALPGDAGLVVTWRPLRAASARSAVKGKARRRFVRRYSLYAAFDDFADVERDSSEFNEALEAFSRGSPDAPEGMLSVVVSCRLGVDGPAGALRLLDPAVRALGGSTAFVGGGVRRLLVSGRYGRCFEAAARARGRPVVVGQDTGAADAAR